MKSENPTASLGALQQMAVAKMADLKAQRDADQKRKAEEQQRKDEEERLRNQSYAQKALDRTLSLKASFCVGKTRRNSQPHLDVSDDMTRSGNGLNDSGKKSRNQ